MTDSQELEKQYNFIGITKSKNKLKKYDAYFVNIDNSDDIIETSFGQRGADDYTTHKNKDRRNRYISRHWKDLNTNNPKMAGYLSMYILWNKNTLQESLKDYKRRYKYFLKKDKFPVTIKDMPTKLLEDLPDIGIKKK